MTYQGYSARHQMLSLHVVFLWYKCSHAQEKIVQSYGHKCSATFFMVHSVVFYFLLHDTYYADVFTNPKI